MYAGATNAGQTNQIPGYTGYMPAHVREEEEQAALNSQIQAENDPRGTKIPGYKGYVPGLKSENVFAATFGQATRGQKEGIYPRGFDSSNAERYQTVTKNTFTNQVQQKVFGAQYSDVGPADGMSYEEACAHVTASRISDPTPMPKVPLLAK